MKLSALAKKPQLIKVELNDEKIVSKYGETLEFWIYDRYEMETYLKLMNSEDSDFASLSKIIKTMVMEEDGSPIFNDGEIVPPDVLSKMVEEVINRLGNYAAQTLVE